MKENEPQYNGVKQADIVGVLVEVKNFFADIHVEQNETYLELQKFVNSLFKDKGYVAQISAAKTDDELSAVLTEYSQDVFDAASALRPVLELHASLRIEDPEDASTNWAYEILERLSKWNGLSNYTELEFLPAGHSVAMKACGDRLRLHALRHTKFAPVPKARPNL